MQSTSLSRPTKYEQQRIEAMLKLGCCCCAQLALWNIAECQHIVEGNRRLGHWYTLPVCPGHHRRVWTPEQVELIPPDVLVSIADGSKVFERVYGTQRELWIKVQGRLGLPAVWPTSKILPRRGYERDLDVLLQSPALKMEVPQVFSRSPSDAHGADLSGIPGSGAQDSGEVAS